MGFRPRRRKRQPERRWGTTLGASRVFEGKPRATGALFLSLPEPRVTKMLRSYRSSLNNAAGYKGTSDATDGMQLQCRKLPPDPPPVVDAGRVDAATVSVLFLRQDAAIGLRPYFIRHITDEGNISRVSFTD